MTDHRNIEPTEIDSADTAGVASVFTRLQGRLRGVARRLLRDDDDAADAVQEAFCRLWTKRDRINNAVGGNAEALTVTTVRNVCIDMLRRQAAHPEDSLDEKGVENRRSVADEEHPDEAQLSERVNSLYAAMESLLTPRQREMLLHRDRDGWSVEELAAHYSLSEANVRTIISRARKTVRDAFVNKASFTSPKQKQ